MKVDRPDQRILGTGTAGFIGYYPVRCLLSLSESFQVVVFDNLNDYYGLTLKMNGLSLLAEFPNFSFIQGNLADQNSVMSLFDSENPNLVVNLTAQAGVRYSGGSPNTYAQSNTISFFNLFEACRHYPVKYLMYASSSPVYGNQKKIPFSISNPVDHPISLYAATKKSNKLLAYSYSRLFGIPSTGLHFSIVHAPYGRPNMAYFSFTMKIPSGETIQVYSNGNLYRDFTYIDDVAPAIGKVLLCPPYRTEDESNELTSTPNRIYNIGSNRPEKLAHFSNVLEQVLCQKAKIGYLPIRSGEGYQTFADITESHKDFGFQGSVKIERGLTHFANCINYAIRYMDDYDYAD